ncbi:hypothetical protein [Streptomyces sp. NPDC059271]|uniref:hypothetical protein n=1 Tax=Streptomyces sp. NPDC059271 TaxID=3346799 RepID=UPI00369F3907
MASDHPSPARRGIRSWFVVPLVLVALVVGYLLAFQTKDAGGTSPVADSKVTRESGDSVIHSDDGSPTVNLRSCPGLPNAGQTFGCDIADTLPNGTVVSMKCWIDHHPAPGHPDNARRWFIVSEGANGPHPGRIGYVFSAEIPVSEQIRTPLCTNDMINRLFLQEPDEPVPTTAEPEHSTEAPPPTPTVAPTATSPAGTPTATAPEPVASPVTSAPENKPEHPSAHVTVDNRVTNGPTQMREDTAHLAYLSTKAVKFCKRQDSDHNCAVSGTDMGSGAALTAECYTNGERVTNGMDQDTLDDHNPGLYESTLWYRIRWSDGRTGYLSEVWLARADRGGAGLPPC